MKKIAFLLLIFVLLLLLAGCGGAQTGDSTPTPGASATATTAPTAQVEATAAVPGMPVGLCTEDCVVVDFQVWQDFMPSKNASNAPLHATVTLDIQWPQKITPDIVQGKITLLRVSGEEVTTGDVQLGQQADDLGMMQPGPQQVVFIMVPQTITTQLTAGEKLQGTITLTLGGQTRTIDLPEAALLFTH